MSNNKQSSVEMIEEFLLSHCNPTICNVEWSDFKLMLEQAKAMHKEEIEASYSDGYKEGYNRAIELTKWTISNLIPPHNEQR